MGTNIKSLELYDFSPLNEKFLRLRNFSLDDFIFLKIIFEKPNHHIYYLYFSSNSKFIATGSNDKIIKYLLFLISIFLLVGSTKKIIYIWDSDSGKKINTLIGHEKDINSLKFSNNENSQMKLLGNCGIDKKICFHDYRTKNPIKNFKLRIMKKLMKLLLLIILFVLF